MTPPRIWKLGEECRVICPDGRKVDATVELASSNGFSLAVSFEAIVGGWVGMMALLWSAERARFKDFRGEPFELRDPHGHG